VAFAPLVFAHAWHSFAEHENRMRALSPLSWLPLAPPFAPHVATEAMTPRLK
jgi:hypothetical protein